MFDDGSSENAIAFGQSGVNDAQSVWFDQFNVVAGGESITSVSVAWGTPTNSTPASQLNGMPVTIGIWSDPNNDGNPNDAVLIGSVTGTIQNANTDTFVTYTFETPVTVGSAGTSFFAGDVTPAFSDGQLFYEGIDTDNSAGHSYLAAMSSGAPADFQNLGNNDFLGTIDSFGLPGNWMIRADAGAGSPTPTPTPTPTPSSTPTPTPMGDALWYNGDFDGVNGLANQENVAGSGQYARVYDDFIVTDSSGWDVTSVFSNDLSATNITGATWEIRQGVSSGNGGTIVASGMTATPAVTPTGRTGFGFTEFTVQVNGISVHLDSPSGDSKYWLNVAPIGDASGQAYDSTTSGANCIGTPCGNDGMAFFDSDYFGFNFLPSDDPALGNGRDFSMGVNGTTGGGGGGNLTLDSAVSRKTQGTAGTFDIPLPLTGSVGIEDRDGGKDTLVLTFNNNVTGAGSASSSCGTAGVTTDPNDSHNLIVTVGSSHCNAETITVTVTGITDDQGNTGSATVSYGKLLGDVNGDGIVNNKDAGTIRHNSPRRVNSSNFRDDINLDGSVNNKDLYFVKANRGSSL